MTEQLKQLITEHKISFKDSTFVSHMLLDNAGIRVDCFTIVWPGNKIDGKTIYRQVKTPRTKMQGWGKGKTIFYIVEEKPEFATLEQLIIHHKNA